MIGADVARSTPVRNCFGTGRTFTWNHSRKQDGWVSIRGRRPRFERRPKAVSEDWRGRKGGNGENVGKRVENVGKRVKNVGKRVKMERPATPLQARISEKGGKFMGKG